MKDWLVVYKLSGFEDTFDMTVSAANRIAAYDIFEDIVRANDWEVDEVYCSQLISV